VLYVGVVADVGGGAYAGVDEHGSLVDIGCFEPRSDRMTIQLLKLTEGHNEALFTVVEPTEYPRDPAEAFHYGKVLATVELFCREHKYPLGVLDGRHWARILASHSGDLALFAKRWRSADELKRHAIRRRFNTRRARIAQYLSELFRDHSGDFYRYPIQLLEAILLAEWTWSMSQGVDEL